MHSVGIVLHPRRDSAEAVDAILAWAARGGVDVFGIGDEIARLNCAAKAVSAGELARRSDLLVSIGGDGTMLRAMRLADGQRAPVLGVNLGKLGFLAEVDVPELPAALSAIDAHEFTTEPRLAIDCYVGDPDGVDGGAGGVDGADGADGVDGKRATAFNDIAVVRVPGDQLAARAAWGLPADAFVILTVAALPLM